MSNFAHFLQFQAVLLALTMAFAESDSRGLKGQQKVHTNIHHWYNDRRLKGKGTIGNGKKCGNEVCHSSEAPFCYTIDDNVQACGCETHADCVDDKVCEEYYFPCGTVGCTKQCVCSIASDAGCGDGEYCNVYLAGPTCQQCKINPAEVGDDGCDIEGETCGEPSCVADAPPFCSSNHDVDCRRPQ